MKKLFIIIVLFSLFTKSNAQSGIKFFSGTLKEAFAKAKAEKKGVFFDAYAVWCGPCKAMEATVFSDSTVGKYFNENFISIRVDMEKGEGPELAKIFPSINGYPSMIFMDSRGNVIKTLLGSRFKDELLGEAMLVRIKGD